MDGADISDPCQNFQNPSEATLRRLERLPVALAGGKPIPLHELADVCLERTPPNRQRREYH